MDLCYIDLIQKKKKNRRCRNQDSMAFQIPSASKDAYEKSFFPQTIRDWNVLPDSLIPLLHCRTTANLNQVAL